MERPQSPWHGASCLAQDPHPSPGRRMEHSPRGGIDAQTLEIRAAEFTTSDVGPSHGLQANHERATDAPMLPERLDHIPPDQEIASVTAPSHGLQANRCRATDGAFDTRKCHDAIHRPPLGVQARLRGNGQCIFTCMTGAARGAAAIIPPRKPAKPCRPDSPGAIARNEALRASRRFGLTIRRPLSAASCGCACRAMDGAAIIAEAASRCEEDRFPDDRMVIPPFLTGCIRRIYAAIFSFMAGVMPPMPMFGRSLLYVQSHCVA